MPPTFSSSNGANSSSTERGGIGSRLVAAPSIDLPKGGGALKGIDEQFRSNPATGSASFSLPLPLSPSRGNFTPELSLSYDSGSGNGPFGLGWALSVPSVSRKTDKGLPRYSDKSESDTFVLSGSDDLVPVGDAFLRDGFTVCRYRPRIEDGFTRIEKWTNGLDGVSHWRTISADNITRVYGFSPESRLSDPSDPKRAFRWLLEFSSDGKGNCASYQWKAEDPVGVNGSLSERNRLNGNALWANRYLKRVSYGNAVPYKIPASGFSGVPAPSDLGCLFDFIFDYGEHGVESPAPEDGGAWDVRPDPFSDCRARFEVRSWRRCKRVLMFHSFAELGEAPVLVRSLDFEYGSNDSGISQLISATQKGYVKNAGGGYECREQPPMRFAYQNHQWNAHIHTVDAESLSGLPAGLATPGAHFTDLYGEGLSGVLIEQSHGWSYKRNEGCGRFGPAVPLKERPFTGSASGIQELEGDSEKYLVELAGGAPGFYRLDDGGVWQAQRQMANVPHIDLQSPSVRTLDLDGDGRADLLVDEGASLLYYRSKGKEGFSVESRFGKSFDEEKGPRIVFADKEQSIFIADMNGDGLSDIVRVRNGNACYWPNLGYGRFGAKVGMECAPLMDRPELFSASRVRLADVDGSGPADLIYIGYDKLTVWLNKSGNGFAPAKTVFPSCAFDDKTEVAVLDLLGEGTACVVWSSPLAMNAGRSLRYIDLMGGKKPHLMVGYSNGFGKSVHLEYTPSTKFYLADRKAETPWVTRLPFPVHCLAKAETLDAVRGSRFCSSYSYHHGYYDIPEREFRGFGRVDAVDGESFEGYKDASNGGDSSLYQAPALTRTWHHLGAWIKDKGIFDHYASEYHPVYNEEGRLPSPEFDPSWTAEEKREASRAFKGVELRRETYMLDGLDAEKNPCLTSQNSYSVRMLQGKGENRHACFQALPSETLSYYYERELSDPRATHTLVLQSDGYGRPELSASVVYGRKGNETSGNPRVDIERKKEHIVISETVYADKVDNTDAFRIGLECASRSYELTWPNRPQGLLGIASLKETFGGAYEIPFEAAPSTTIPEKRLVESVETIYLSENLLEPLPFGEMASHGLHYESYALAWTEGLLEHVYGADKRPDADMLRAGGYVQKEENGPWHARTGREIYAANAAERFYLPRGVEDAFGAETTLSRDSYDLLVESVTDALGNAATAQNDYRTLSPWMLTDPNGNRTSVETDALGIVIKTAAMGKAGAGEGDTLEDPTAKMKYGFAAFDGEGKLIQPAWVRTSAREIHGNSNFRWLEKVEYSEGLGNVILTKVQAEPGLAKKWNPETKTVEEIYTDKRWVGTGRTILNNKGNPVKQYEPYFSITDVYESEAEIVETGVTPILHYDALDRLIRTDYPDGTHSKVEFTAWEQKDFDQNDTDIGNPHFGTPTAKHLDSLGRIICIVQDNGKDSQGNPLLYETFMELDIEGNEKSVTDARGNAAMAYKYGIHGEKGYSKSADAGERMLFITVDGQPLLTWDGMGRRMRAEFDALRRPKEQWLSVNGGGETLVGLTEYGEEAENPETSNLRGKAWKNYDQSGKTENTQFDFKGNLLEGKRQYTVEYKQTIDWNVDEPNALLQEEIFTTITNYDALNRATNIKTPHNAQVPASEVLPGYDAGGMLNAVNVKLRGSSEPTAFVANINYNPKSQRERIQYGNGATTGYSYDEKTFRLKRLLTTRNNGADRLQDLNYSYDPVGNVMQIVDNAQQALFFNGAEIKANQKFEYDALYRLTKAEGREHVSMGADSEPEIEGYNPAQISPEDGSAMRNYTREWEYDQVGNILAMIHQANANSWTRNYAYAAGSNRLNSTSVGQTTVSYSYNENGSMSSMPHLQSMEWDFAERLSHVTRGTTEAYYNYDGSGQRARKVVEKGNIIEERLYLGGFEIFRKTVSGSLETERETLHVMDDQKRIAVVETLTVNEGVTIATPVSVQRYQLGNHLESASLELDENANIISHEEYYPYGDTSYRAGRNIAETSQKRYRYTGKEKDEESGLYYYGARYYACWLGRWTAADPAGMVDGTNLYAYCRGNPVKLVDPEGMQADETESDGLRIETDENGVQSLNCRRGIAQGGFEPDKTAVSILNSQDKLIDKLTVAYLKYASKNAFPATEWIDTEIEKEEAFKIDADLTVGILTKEFATGTGKEVRKFYQNEHPFADSVASGRILEEVKNDLKNKLNERNQTFDEWKNSGDTIKTLFEFSPDQINIITSLYQHINSNLSQLFIGGAKGFITAGNKDTLNVILENSTSRGSLMLHLGESISRQRGQQKPLSTIKQKVYFKVPYNGVGDDD